MKGLVMINAVSFVTLILLNVIEKKTAFLIDICDTGKLQRTKKQLRDHRLID